MNTSIMISIQPTWCELILSRKKILELRKTRPKIGLPFKCYIYCTSGSLLYCKHVVAEFICDQIEEVAVSFRGGNGQLRAVAGNEVWHSGLLESYSCLSAKEISSYIGGISGKGYAWHISNLQIYDTPKHLQSFTQTVDRGGWISA